jgi:hypothetical protein
MKGLTDCEYLCKSTRVKWKKLMGDWLDKNGVLNGPMPTISGSGSGVGVPISTVPRDLLIQGINGVSKITIDDTDVSANCFWTDPTSNNSLPLPSHYGNPVVVPNTNGTSMVVTSNATVGWRVDPIAEPTVPDFPYTGTYTPPDVFLVECSSRDSILKTVPGTVAAGGEAEYVLIPPQPEFLTDGALKYIRIPNRSTDFHPRLTNWLYPLPGMEEAYCGHAIYLEDDVWDQMIELGVKSSGPGGGTNESFHLIGEHSAAYYKTKNPANRQVFGLDYYKRDVSTGGSNPTGNPSGAVGLLTSGRWYWLETGMKLNTVGQKDGWGRMWINGNLVLDLPFQWRANPASRINTFQVQLYHGGLMPWLGQVHYRQAKLCASSKYIGVPPELR